MNSDFEDRPSLFLRPIFWQWFLVVAACLIYVFSFHEQFSLAWDRMMFFLTTFFSGQVLQPPSAEEKLALWITFYGPCGFLMYFLLAVFFFSHFLLPIQDWKDYLVIFGRQLLYLVGFHGPAIFVREGTQLAEPEELSRHRPGVLFIDLASVVVMEKLWGNGLEKDEDRDLFINHNDFAEIDTQIRNNKYQLNQAPFRILGPGVSYTKWGERIAGVVDLRKQVRFARGVEAFTRDGIQVKTNVFVVYTLGEHPNILPVTFVDGKFQVIKIDTKIVQGVDGTTIHKRQIIGFSDELDEQDQNELDFFTRNAASSSIKDIELPVSFPYTFSPSRVFQALYSRAFDPKSPETPASEWHELPLRIATELFRHILIRETFDALHAPEDPKLFPVLVAKRHFAQLLQGQGVLGFQYYGRNDDRNLTVGDTLDDQRVWKGPKRLFHNPKILRDRGVKVIHAGFGELIPTNDIVREHQRENARARWQSQAIKNQASQNLQVGRILIQARAQAQQDMIYSLSQIFRSSPHSEEALAMRIYQALESVATDPKARKFLPRDTINMLWSLRQWLSPDGQRGQDVLPHMDNMPPNISNLPDQDDTDGNNYE
jgi:hypothetical protein